MDSHENYFLTSVTGQTILGYPIDMWNDVEWRLVQLSSALPSRRKFLDRVSFFGRAERVGPSMNCGRLAETTGGAHGLELVDFEALKEWFQDYVRDATVESRANPRLQSHPSELDILGI